MSDNITRSLRVDPKFYHAVKDYANATDLSISEAVEMGAKAFYLLLTRNDPLARKILGKYFNPIESFSFSESIRIALQSVDGSAFRLNLNEIREINELEKLEISFLVFIDEIRERKKQIKENSE